MGSEGGGEREGEVGGREGEGGGGEKGEEGGERKRARWRQIERERMRRCLIFTRRLMDKALEGLYGAPARTQGIIISELWEGLLHWFFISNSQLRHVTEGC